MSALTEAEILREARRVFRKLADPKARLVRLNASSWTVVQRGARESGRVKVREAMVTAFKARGWLAADGEALVLSEAGRNWTVAEVAGLDLLQAQHQRLALRPIANEQGLEQVVAVNEAESPLGWLKSRGAVDDMQFEAGERLRRDYTLAQLEPRLCIDLSAPVVLASRNPHGPAMPDSVLAAKQRFSKAMRAAGPGLSDLLFDVCCAFKGLEAAEKNMGWPRRSGKVVLGLALDRLAAHYGMRPSPTSSRLRSWSVDFLAEAVQCSGR